MERRLLVPAVVFPGSNVSIFFIVAHSLAAFVLVLFPEMAPNPLSVITASRPLLVIPPKLGLLAWANTLPWQ